MSLLGRHKGSKWEEGKEDENGSLGPQADPSLAKFFVKKEEDPSERKDV